MNDVAFTVQLIGDELRHFRAERDLIGIDFQRARVRDDRVKQVVGLKLQLKGGFGFAKPGMPADGEILVSGNSWPKVSHK